MKYNLAVPQQAQAALGYFNKLKDNKQIVEVKKVSPKRTLNQNAYLHLIIAAFGVHFGYGLSEAKTLYKRDANPDIYVYEKNGILFLRSSADLTKEEMAQSIDNFMRYSADAGYALPLATDTEWLLQIEQEIERSKYF